MPDVNASTPGGSSDSDSGGPTIPSTGSESSPCAGCGNRINDRFYLLAVDKKWHGKCLRCYECKVTLDSELTCFVKDGSIYCREDYYRLFALTKCGRCRLGILSNEMIMRAKDLVFHLTCFTCAWCNVTLTQGDHFGMKDDLIYCRAHYEILVQGEYSNLSEGLPSPAAALSDGCLPSQGLYFSRSSSRSSPTVSPSSPHHSPFFHHQPVTAVRKGRPKKRKTTSTNNASNNNGGGGNDNLTDVNRTSMPNTPDDISNALAMDGRLNLGGHGGDRGLLGHQSQRAKRMRTSFKHHQLRTMKSYFAINQNPDAKDLKQLAQKTGLSKRVLQVWFQNARAKWRRNSLKQEGKCTDLLQSDGNSSTPPHMGEIGHNLSDHHHHHHHMDMMPSPSSLQQQNSLHNLIGSSSEMLSDSDEGRQPNSNSFHEISELGTGSNKNYIL